MTAATTPDGTDFALICDSCGQSVTGLGATMHNWDLVWSLFRRHGWTGARLATGPHSCARCSRVPLAASADVDAVGWLAGDAPDADPAGESAVADGELAGGRVTRTTTDEALVVTLHGEPDAQVGLALREALAPPGYRQGHLVLDLSDVETIDTTALTMLVAARHRAAQAGGHTCLVGLSPAVRRTLHTLCLLHLFVVMSDVPAALSWLRGDDAPQPGAREAATTA